MIMNTSKNNTGKNNRGVQIAGGIMDIFKENQEILIGTLLGDASLQTYSDGKT